MILLGKDLRTRQHNEFDSLYLSLKMFDLSHLLSTANQSTVFFIGIITSYYHAALQGISFNH